MLGVTSLQKRRLSLIELLSGVDYVLNKQISEPEASSLDLKVIFSLFFSACCYFRDKGMFLKS